MIHISGNYYLKTDAMQYIICEKVITQKGTTKYRDLAFCGNLTQLKNWLFDRMIRDNVELLQNIDKCIELSNKIDEKFSIKETE